MTSSRKNNAGAKLLPLGALAAGFGLAGSAWAQQLPPASDEAVDNVLPVVRAKAAAEKQGKDAYQATESRIGKGKQELRDIPQSVTVVTEKLMDDRNLDNLKDVLKNTAGITFQAAEGGEEDIKLRGFSLQASGDVFIDGLRDPAFYERDTFFQDRVELLRGSASLLFGRGSTGGAVNQVSKEARLIDANEISASLGSDSAVRAVGDFNARLGESSAARVGLMFQRADDDGAGNSINKQGLAANLRLGIGERDEFAFSAYYLDNTNGMNYGMPWIRPAPTAPVSSTTLLPIAANSYYGMASDVNKGTAAWGVLKHTHRFNQQTELVTTLRRADYTRDQRAGTVRFAAAALQPDGKPVSLETFGPRTVLTRGLQPKIQDMQTLSLQSDLSSKFKWLNLDHSVQAGVDASEENKQVYAVRSAAQGGVNLIKPNTTVGAPRDGAWVDESLRVLRTNNEYSSRAYGAYAQDLLALSRQWKLLAGLRYDKVRGDYDTFSIPNAAAGPETKASYRMNISQWSQRAAVLFQPNELMSFHLGGATSFNTSGDTYSLSAQNQDIPPEKAINIELGAKIDSADGKLSQRFAIFRSTKLHERNTDPLTSLVTLSGKRHAAGFEYDVMGLIAANWEVFASYTFIPSARIDISSAGSGEVQGDRPSLTPRHSGTLFTTYKLTPQLRVGGGLTGRSGYQPNRNPGFYVPKFVTLGLLAEYELLKDKLTLRANVNNVGNKLYAETVYTGHYVPGKGRTFALTGSYKF
ncbi:TonB-dependent receptor [Paucibacter soli]|uniref:TonB-dependent receptor n=1 Tax=Paucibacter soli TaxID=3133433 RepID=UPI0030962483